MLGPVLGERREWGREDRLAQLFERDRRLRAIIDELADSIALLASEDCEIHTGNAKIRAEDTLGSPAWRCCRRLGLSGGNGGKPLSARDTEGEQVRRQVSDLPPIPSPESTRHQARACRCSACGALTRAGSYSTSTALRNTRTMHTGTGYLRIQSQVR